MFLQSEYGVPSPDDWEIEKYEDIIEVRSLMVGYLVTDYHWLQIVSLNCILPEIKTLCST